MLSKKYKFLFIHIPKTAGTSIENYFVSLGIGKQINSTGAAYGDLIPNLGIGNPFNFCGAAYGAKLNRKGQTCCYYKGFSYTHAPVEAFKEHIPIKEYFKFTFVRNPWDRFVSEYKNRVRIGTTHSTFDEFITSKLQFKFSWADCHLMPQSRFIHINNNMAVDFIGRYENLEQDFKYVCEKLNLGYSQLAHLNKSQGRKYVEYYNDNTKELIGQRYKEDIELFNYKFD